MIAVKKIKTSKDHILKKQEKTPFQMYRAYNWDTNRMYMVRELIYNTYNMVRGCKKYSNFWQKIVANWQKKRKNTIITGQNLSFERKWLLKNGSTIFIDNKKFYDTMLQIPNPKGTKKFPRLTELAAKYLTNEQRQTHHRALNDAIMTCHIANKALVIKGHKPITEVQLLKGLKR